MKLAHLLALLPVALFPFCGAPVASARVVDELWRSATPFAHRAPAGNPAARLTFQDDRSILPAMSRPRKSEPTRLRLLEAGAAMLLDQGYHGTGIQAVLDEVGVPKGSFYNYFESKEHFAAEVIRHAAGGACGGLDELAREAEKDALGALRRHLKRRIRAYEGDCCGGCLIGNLGAEIEDSELCRAALAEAMDGMAARYAAVLALGQAQGTIRDDVAAADLGAQLLDAWEGALLRMKVQRSTGPLKLVVKRLLEGDFRA
jgi:TetR/AcrR family transcriptional repressor of nem operon